MQWRHTRLFARPRRRGAAERKMGGLERQRHGCGI